MSLAKTIKFGEQILLWGDMGSPEIFTPFCGFTSLELTVNIETNSTNVPDCDNPDLPAWLSSDEVSKQMQLGGDGVIDTVVLDRLNDWVLEGGERNFRWLTSSATNPEANGYWEAPGIMSAYSQTGERGQRWNQSITILLNGQPVRVDIPPAPASTTRISLPASPAPKVGVSKSGVAGTWAGSPTPALTYEWEVSDNGTSGWVNATGTGAATIAYTPVVGDVGKFLRVIETATNVSGTTSLASNTSAAVEAA